MTVPNMCSFGLILFSIEFLEKQLISVHPDLSKEELIYSPILISATDSKRVKKLENNVKKYQQIIVSFREENDHKSVMTILWVDMWIEYFDKSTKSQHFPR